jgi:dipeptidyl aminopeptidase/acylaminoacyl peptidase
MRTLLQILTAAAMLAATTASAEIPVRDFARWNDYDNVKISPDGKHVAVSRWLAEGQLGLAFIDLASRKVTGTLALVRGDTPIHFAWTGPGRIIIPVAKQLGPLDQLRLTGEIIAINADGTGKRYLFGQRGGQGLGSRLHVVEEQKAFAFLEDPLEREPDHALVSIWSWDKPMDRTFPFIDRINVLTGERRRVGMVPSYNADVLADGEGVPRFGSGIAPDGQCCELVALAPGNDKWKTLDKKFPTVGLLAVSRDATSAFFTTQAPGRPSCLHEYGLERGEIREVLCDAAIELDALLTLDQRRPFAVVREAGKPQTTYLDATAAEARVQKSLEHAFAGQRVRVTSATLDGDKMVVLVDSDRNPGDFYLFDRANKKVDLIMTRRSWIDPAAMQPMEPFDYAARDGMQLHGYVTAPGGLAARSLPMIVVPHGGPHGIRDWWEWNAEVQLLASRGYAVLQPQFRGSGGYGWDYEKAGHGKWGAAMQDDITDAVQWAVKQGIADPARICIYGGSFGGYAALMSAMREPGLYRCAVGSAGAYDLAGLAADSDIAQSWAASKSLARSIGDDKAAMAAQSPVTHVGKLKAPVLIVHGTSDRRVPFSQAKALRAALDKAGKPYEWLEFPGEEHGLSLAANRELFYSRLLEFFGKHLGGTAAQPPPRAATTTATAPAGG